MTAEPKRIYLSGPFSWRENLRELAKECRKAGWEVTSRWLDRQEADGDTSRWRDYANDDLQDIEDSNVLVLFTRTEGAALNRNSRLWEAGYAYGQMVRVVEIGPPETIFSYLDNVVRYGTWREFREKFLCEGTAVA